MADSQHSSLVSASVHEPKHVTGALTSDNGKIITPSAATAGVSVIEFPLQPITVKMEDISTAKSVWVAPGYAGTFVKMASTIDGAIITADCAITTEIGGTAVTDGTLTIAFTGSAAGDVDTGTPSAANTFTAAQAIEIISDGASGNAVDATFTIWVRRSA